MWKTERHSSKIERVECTRVSALSVWFMRQAFVIGGKQPAPVETKAGRRGVNTNYHSTWLEAHAHLMEDAQFAVQSKRRQLELANAYLGNVKGLKAPDSAVVAQ
jgi:hypothetical protein